MTIALLNTKNLNVEHIQNLLKHWISTKQMPLNIVPFSSYPQLIQFLIAHDHKALVLIVTPQYLELYDEVKHQRLYFQNDCIAFMDFYQFLEESRFSSNTIKALAIETPNEVTRLCKQDILYAEVNNHTTTYHTSHQHISKRGTMNDILNTLGEDGFIRIHRSYVVSKSKIQTIKKTYPHTLVVLSEGATIELPISRHYIKQLINGYRH